MKKFILFLVLILFCASIYSANKQTCTTHRKQFINNDKVRVWSTVICPNSHLKFHTHKFPRILISSGDGTIKVLYKNKKSLLVHVKKNKPIWLSHKEGLAPHEDINLSNKPMRVIVVAVK